MGPLQSLFLVCDLGDDRRALLLFAEARELLIEHDVLTFELLAASLSIKRCLLRCERRRREFRLQFADATRGA